MNLQDTLERMLWTIIAASGSSVLAATALDVDAGKAAAVAGITAAINFVTIVARQRLSVLPDPGAGFSRGD